MLQHIGYQRQACGMVQAHPDSSRFGNRSPHTLGEDTTLLHPCAHRFTSMCHRHLMPSERLVQMAVLQQHPCALLASFVDHLYGLTRKARASDSACSMGLGENTTSLIKMSGPSAPKKLSHADGEYAESQTCVLVGSGLRRAPGRRKRRIPGTFCQNCPSQEAFGPWPWPREITPMVDALLQNCAANLVPQCFPEVC